MSDNQSPMKMFTAGFSCAQIVASYCAEACGNDPKTARIAMGGFGGGAGGFSDAFGGIFDEIFGGASRNGGGGGSARRQQRHKWNK